MCFYDASFFLSLPGRFGQGGMYRAHPHFPTPLHSWLGSDKMAAAAVAPTAYNTPAASWHTPFAKTYQPTPTPAHQTHQAAQGYAAYGYPPTPPDDTPTAAAQQGPPPPPQPQPQEHPMSASPMPQLSQEQQQQQQQQAQSEQQPAARMTPDRVTASPGGSIAGVNDIKVDSSYTPVFSSSFPSKPSLSLSPAHSTAHPSGYTGYPTHSSMDFAHTGYSGFYPSSGMSSMFSKPFHSVPSTPISPSQEKSKNTKRSSTGKTPLDFGSCPPMASCSLCTTVLTRIRYLHPVNLRQAMMLTTLKVPHISYFPWPTYLSSTPYKDKALKTRKVNTQVILHIFVLQAF